MAKSPPLLAERLTLQPFDDEFLTLRYVGWLNDPETVRYSEQRHRAHTLESCRAYAQRFSDSPNFFWAVVTNDPVPRHIGNLTATLDLHNRVAELAILIGDAKMRGHGYGHEAWRRACRFLLNEAGMRKVAAGTMSINEPMLKIMRTTGMVEEGRRKRQFLVDGQEVDAVLMALFPS
jgi:[ribosomal protein S5]-alanine N-acetyltransferase